MALFPTPGVDIKASEKPTKWYTHKRREYQASETKLILQKFDKPKNSKQSVCEEHMPTNEIEFKHTHTHKTQTVFISLILQGGAV